MEVQYILVIILNAFLIYFIDHHSTIYLLSVIEFLLIVYLAYRLTKRPINRFSKRSISRPNLTRLASLTYTKMEVYYKKHLNNAIGASSKCV